MNIKLIKKEDLKMPFFLKPFGTSSTSDNVNVENDVKPKHYINIRGCTVPTHFESEKLRSDEYEFQKKM